jgi:hypothetical protein
MDRLPQIQIRRRSNSSKAKQGEQTKKIQIPAVRETRHLKPACGVTPRCGLHELGDESEVSANLAAGNLIEGAKHRSMLRGVTASNWYHE